MTIAAFRRPVRSAAVLLLLCAAFVLQSGGTRAQPANADRRLALVIGNSDYKSLPRLKNAVFDAELIRDALKSVGFETTFIHDTGKSDIEQALIAFRRSIEPGSNVVIYYAGHGLQASDENYLVPTDAQLTDALDLPLVAVSAGQVLSQLESTKAGSIIFILDACRDNPLADKGPKSRSVDGNSETRGLARIASKHTGTLIAFSTAPGEVAQDGRGANSPYSKALAAALKEPGQSIESIFKRTRAKVVEDTEGRQVPWENSSLVQDIMLVPKPGEPAVVVPSPCDLAAAHPSDPMRVGPSVDYGSLDPQIAIPACEQAVAEDPANMRYKSLLARALDKSGRGEEAKALNEVGIKAGYLGAYHNMGNLYRKGLGVEKDPEKAFSYYLYAAERGHPEDQYNVGYMYMQGSGVDVDYKKARLWLEKATKQNWATAFDKIGLLYLNGWGVGKDPAKAFAQFEKGANLGDPYSMVNTANSYKDGIGVETDFRKAHDLFTQAARLGVSAAYVNLGLMAANGQGMAPDPVEAAFWFTLASRDGHDFAQQQLQDVDARLSEPEKDEVRQRLDEWSHQRFG